MSGRVVIDILSSPDQPPPPPCPVVSRHAPASKKIAEDYVTVLSSDDELPPPVKLASNNLVSAISTSKSATFMTVAKPATTDLPSAVARPQNEFLFHSDDFDSTVNFDSSAVKYDDDPFASDPPLPPARKRRVSVSPKPASRSFGKFKRTKTTGSAPVDHITFTSSPDHVAEAVRRRKEKHDKSRKDGLVEDVELGAEKGVAKTRTGQEPTWDFNGLDDLAESGEDDEDEDLPDLASLPKVYKSTSKPMLKPTSKSTSSQKALDKYNADKAKDKVAKEKLEKVREKTEKSKEKAAAKEAEKEEKLREKEKKLYEKKLVTELAKVNTLKTDKKISTPEMIIDLPSCLDSILLEQAIKMLGQHEVEHQNWESELPVIKWRRKVTATYNEEAGHWEPTPLKIKKEKHIMCLLNAQVLVDLITGAEGSDLDAYTLRLKAQFEPCEVIYLVEGFMAWMRKNKVLLNRQYTAAVRSHNQEFPTASQRKRKKKDADYVNEDLIEDALLRLQVNHNAFIHHTNAPVETAEWILNFTQHISSIPYKSQKASLDTNFCMDSGQVKTGTDAADTYVRMLQEIFRVTAPIAYGIVAEFPTLPELVKVLEDQGPLALEDCRKSTNKDGAFSDKRIGPAISRKIHKVFLERDPGVWIV
ncbi:uncharacterized protein RCO7_04877 [Rhynchosporium graminicola]|uniref:ERCC4 domain-containing protein n=1 Tax=Rhynchosporium graminicola TaxID=2792576 RepID=A0A1E1KEK3_9HELO|nr:uncharacterized protein RCO7_04877 [Rhynchosporium commune]